MFGLRVKGEDAFRVDVQAFCGAHLSNMSQNETYFFGTAEFFSHYQIFIILIRIFWTQLQDGSSMSLTLLTGSKT